MSWFYEKWSVESEKNGEIRCVRSLGDWSVVVDGCEESSSYMVALWKQALKRVPRTAKIKRILMLGLAAGATIEMIHRRFPGCQITAVEWDPEMIKIMDRLRLFQPKHRPNILLGDAAQVIPALRETFDLILFDLYQGPVSPASVRQQSFFEALKVLLKREGYFLVNVYLQTSILETLRTLYAHQSSWMYRLNHVSLFRHVGLGTLGDPLPQGYCPFRGIKEYIERETGVDPSATMVGSPSVYGFRYWQGPACVEKYFGDIEPMLDDVGPKRLVIWQPITRVDIPAGWRRSRVQMNAKVTGFVERKAENDPIRAWSTHARRQLKKFLAHQQDDHMVAFTLEQFLSAYRMSPMKGSIKQMMEKILIKKAQAHADRLYFFGCVSRIDQSIKGGFAALEIPEGNQSIHIASFVNASSKHDGTGTGLVYEWFKDCERRHVRFLDFDLFAGAYDSRSWRGFSRFKGQFGTTFIKYPHPLLKWAGTWKAYFEHFKKS